MTAREGDRIRVTIEGVVDGRGKWRVPTTEGAWVLDSIISEVVVIEERYDPTVGDRVSWTDFLTQQQETGVVSEIGRNVGYWMLTVRVQPSDKRRRSVYVAASSLWRVQEGS